MTRTEVKGRAVTLGNGGGIDLRSLCGCVCNDGGRKFEQLDLEEKSLDFM